MMSLLSRLNSYNLHWHTRLYCTVLYCTVLYCTVLCYTVGLEEIIPTTMGEPLMYKEFPEFIKLCHEFPGIQMNLTTNGSFPGSVLVGIMTS